MSTFLERLQTILEEFPTISRDERDEAKRLISQHRNKSIVCNKGPCMSCGIDIEYSPGRIHIQRGDSWLNSLFARWIYPISITLDRGYREIEIRYNGFKENTVKGYLCSNCWQDISDEAWQKLETFKEELHRQQEKARAESSSIVDKIIRGDQKVSPSKRFNTMVSNLGQISIDRLNEMSYDDFLTTFYWDIVRKYKLHRAGYKCELCNTSDVLNVHHKTYEHHGEEHEHLEDLIVLCRECHQKFHDIAA